MALAPKLSPEQITRGGDALIGVYFAGHRPAPKTNATMADKDDVLLRRARGELNAYLRGDLVSFRVPFALRGTAFQRRVWDLLLRIPRGETWTYGALANTLVPLSAARAVGHAVARNPLSILVPCHRVVGARGSLTGYAGGVERKAALLALERAGARGHRRVPSAACHLSPT